MQSNSGRQLLMLDAIDHAEDPPDVPSAEPSELAGQLMNRYMEPMYAEVFERARHPTIMGDAVHAALDLVRVDTLEGAERRNSAAFFRYRGRRTFMEIVTIPEARWSASPNEVAGSGVSIP